MAASVTRPGSASVYTHPNHSGDVTSAGDGAQTIAAGAVTLAKMADMATGSFMGRSTAGVGSPEILSMATATGMLDTFSSVAQGAVPASGGGTVNFLRADGTWAAPSGGGGGGADLATVLSIGNTSGGTNMVISVGDDISSPGAGTGSEQFGTLSVASGFASTSVGNSAKAQGTFDIGIGTSANASGNYGVACGVSSVSSATGGIAIGYATTASSPYSTAIGYNSSASTSNYATAFGSFAAASGLNATAVGRGASATASSAIAVGGLSTADKTTTEQGLVAVGYNSTASGAYATTFGHSSTASGGNSAAFGGFASASGGSGLAMGYSSNASGVGAFAIGTVAAASGAWSMAFGYGTSAGHTDAIAIGTLAASTAANQMVVGAASHAVTSVYIGEGVTDASPPASVTINPTGGSGTNVHASDLVLSAGASTGNAAPASLLFKTTTAVASGPTAQTLATRLTIDSSAATFTLPVGVPSYTVAGAPATATAGRMIFVSNEVGGAVLAFGDGTNWRRVTDRAVIA